MVFLVYKHFFLLLQKSNPLLVFLKMQLLSELISDYLLFITFRQVFLCLLFLYGLVKINFWLFCFKLFY